MSLLPYFLRTALRPTSLFENHLRTMRQMDALIDSFLASSAPSRFNRIEFYDPRTRSPTRIDEPYRIRLDVKHFPARGAVTVKTVDDSVVVEGRHEEESKEEGGRITRHFVKTFPLPYGHEPEDVVSTLSKDGVLTIEAKPAKWLVEQLEAEQKATSEREVPIAVEDGAAEKK